jgi:hypothetical protein
VFKVIVNRGILSNVIFVLSCKRQSKAQFSTMDGSQVLCKHAAEEDNEVKERVIRRKNREEQKEDRPLTLFQFHSMMCSDTTAQWELKGNHVETGSKIVVRERKLTTENIQVSLMGSLMSVEKKERCIVYSLDDGLGEMVNVVLWRDMDANWDDDHFE